MSDIRKLCFHYSGKFMCTKHRLGENKPGACILGSWWHECPDFQSIIKNCKHEKTERFVSCHPWEPSFGILCSDCGIVLEKHDMTQKDLHTYR
ncbi:MAG: hypothetical protein K2H46_00115, partial [Muribaculaceae bacterium]|nr:hypothetical protein [Muribaculaceae bacterium]